MPIQARACGRLLAIACLTAMALLAIAGTAGARTVPVYTYTGKFYDGTGSTAGTLAAGTDVAVNQATQNVYVTDPSRLEGSVSQFDPEGNPLPFSALEGATAVSPHREGADRVAVDNSSMASKGNIYVLAGNVITGYQPDGHEIGGAFPIGGFGAACSLAVDAEGNIWGVDYRRSVMVEYASSGVPTGRKVPFTPIAIGQQNGTCDLAIDSNDNFYLDIAGPETNSNFGKKYDSEGNFLYDFIGGSTFGYAQSVDIDLATNNVFVLQNAFGAEYDTEVVEYDEDGEAITSFGAPDPVHSFLGLTQPPGFAVSGNAEHIYVANGREYGGLHHVEIFAPTAQALVPTTKTEPPELSPTKVTLKGTVDLDGGGAATSCYFEWGSTYIYGQIAECAPAGPITGSGTHTVTAVLEGLTQGAHYHFRLVTKNANGMAFGYDRGFRPQGPLSMSPTVVSDVNTDGTVITSQIDPNGGDVTYFIEYGLEDCDLSTCAHAPAPAAVLPKPLGVQTAFVRLAGLSPDTSYHYRLVATNQFGEVVGNEDVFRTYAVDSTDDRCPNALVRKETATVLLPDCRAYEIVSAQDAGGYDVRSDLVPGQIPLPAKPRANDSILYSLNFGKVPGVTGEPTNNGLDPYVATRTDGGWSTRYAGIAVGDPPYQAPFASTPLEESEDLSTLAFGGPDICSPCFEDGKTGIPVRRNGGALTQGMAGALDPGPAAAPDGHIGRRLSADGTHLVFGSTAAFEQGAAGGDVSIYDRNLVTGVTHVVSKTPGGANLPCAQGPGACHSPGNANGIGSLDVSDDGTRIVVAQRLSTDSAGNAYWHPYMNIGDSQSTVDLAPGTTSGVIFDGMTSDGSSVLYTTVDQLTADDNDSSADIYRADVSVSGDLTITRISQGSGVGDTDACDPVGAPGRNNWNTIGASSPNGCGALAFAGTAGVARGSGTIYFLSPEKLDGGSGSLNQPNLYVAVRGGSPRFIATLEPANPAIADAVQDSEVRSFGDFQVTLDGDFAAFSTGNPLTGFPTFGHVAIYRYDSEGDALTCASCPTTRAALVADTELSRYGLNLTDDGRVFFTSVETLALRDTGSTTDVYERSGERISLISTGRSSTDTGLLSVSADGVNAFFYTRESMVNSDRNGRTMKIYTAREGGGFLSPVVRQECQASDECHGAGSAAPSSSALPTFQGTGGNYSKPVHKKKHKRKKHRKKHGHHQRSGGTTRHADSGRNG